jgi:hypothetical protein
MSRVWNVILLAAFLPLSWLSMMAVHEFGHVLCAWATHGVVAKVVLHPLSLSRTEVSVNPHPLFVVWGGPLFGCIAPLLLWLLWKRLHSRGEFLSRCFAGFCFVANGVYIGTGAFVPVGDAADMLLNGSPTWLLLLFGAIACVSGLLLWNGQAKRFRFDASKEGEALVCAICLGVAIVLELVLSPDGP